QDVFSGVFAWGEDRFDRSEGGAVHLLNGMWVSGGFFRTLGLHPAAGRLIAPSDDRRGCPAVAVLSYGFWQDHFGGAQSAIGSTISLSSHPFEVIGVAQRGFYGMNVGRKFDVAAPICATVLFDGKESRLVHRSWWWLSVVGRLKPGISPAQASARLKVLSPGILTAALPESWSSDLQKEFVRETMVAVPAAAGVSALRREYKEPLDLLMAVVGLVLLIACASIASLMLARGAARHREIAVRQALGANRFRLIRQLLTECFLLSAGGALLGILFAHWGAALLVRVISTTQNIVFLKLPLDSRMLGFTAAVAVLSSFLFGLLPAFRSTRLSLTSAMKGGAPLRMARPAPYRSQRRILAVQLALSLVLLMTAGLLLRSFSNLATVNLGFDRHNVLLVGTNLSVAKVPQDQQLTTYREIGERLRTLPGVVSVGRSKLTPISGIFWNNNIHTRWSNELSGDAALAWLNYISRGYIPTLRMTLLAGRNFSATDTKAAPLVAIINETLARRFFPHLSAIGRTFRVEVGDSGKVGPPIEVVGVARDAKYVSVNEETHPTAFFPAAQISRHTNEDSFELRTAVPPSDLISVVQAAVGSVNKQIPLEFHTLTEQVNDSIAQERVLALLSGFFGALALLLAIVGLCGTFDYLVTQRQSEFGIRMALGAQRDAILRLVMREVIGVLAIGIVIGVCCSLVATHFLQQMLFGLGARDPLTVLAAIGLLSGAALVAGYLPARRATNVDPMVALRHE
ncbi:MAG: ABC transporter permease, partial [Terriglobia bacterium]